MHKPLALAAAALAGLAFTGGSAQKVTLTLDWTPNPDHAGIYDAQQTVWVPETRSVCWQEPREFRL